LLKALSSPRQIKKTFYLARYFKTIDYSVRDNAQI
jgi:hypothetical protein